MSEAAHRRARACFGRRMLQRRSTRRSVRAATNERGTQADEFAGTSLFSTECSTPSRHGGVWRVGALPCPRRCTVFWLTRVNQPVGYAPRAGVCRRRSARLAREVRGGGAQAERGGGLAPRQSARGLRGWLGLVAGNGVSAHEARAVGLTDSPSTGAKRRRSIGSSLRARARRSNPWCAPRRLLQRAIPAQQAPLAAMRSRSTTTIGTARSHARRRVGTASRRFRVRTRPIGTCGTRTWMAWCASDPVCYVSGERSYLRMRIDTANVERWSCSEAHAGAAGWRRAKR